MKDDIGYVNVTQNYTKYGMIINSFTKASGSSQTVPLYQRLKEGS